MYNKDFAEIYNKEWVKFSETLADTVLKISSNYNSVLDLGCGTGNFLKKLEKYFQRTVGVDISKDMIEIAKLNCRNTDLYVGSVTDFNLDEKFDFITCNFDMINHLSTIDEWQKMFKLAYKHLNNNGTFLFDINTIYKYGKLDFSENCKENEKYKIIAKETKIDDNHVQINIKIFDKVDNELACIDEIESFYDETTIIRALNEEGFLNVKFTDMELNEVTDFERNRLFLICKKN